MNSEAHWYSSYTNGARPHSRRLSRLDHAEQWEAAIDLAIAVAEGRAGWRYAISTVTGERYWYWPTSPLNRPGDSGWWLIPYRVGERARRLVDAATWTVIRPYGSCDQEDVAACLRRWKASGRWRRRCWRERRREGATT
jgi:hypothetical protein